jgi:hypothetical protein
MWQLVSKALTRPVEAGEKILQDKKLRAVSGIVFLAGLILAVVWYFMTYLPLKGPNPSVLLLSAVSTGFLWYGLWYGFSIAVHLMAKILGGQGTLKETLIATGVSMVYVCYTPVALIFAGTAVGRYITGLFLFATVIAAVFWLCRVHRLGWLKGIGAIGLPVLVLSLLVGALKAVGQLW